MFYEIKIFTGMIIRKIADIIIESGEFRLPAWGRGDRADRILIAPYGVPTHGKSRNKLLKK
jgi:hypothetical protein